MTQSQNKQFFLKTNVYMKNKKCFSHLLKNCFFILHKMAVGTWSLKHNGKKERSSTNFLHFSKLCFFQNFAFSKIFIFYAKILWWPQDKVASSKSKNDFSTFCREKMYSQRSKNKCHCLFYISWQWFISIHNYSVYLISYQIISPILEIN